MQGFGEEGRRTAMDQQIVDLFFDRSESAIAQAEQEYGAYCFQIAYNILGDREDGYPGDQSGTF